STVPSVRITSTVPATPRRRPPLCRDCDAPTTLYTVSETNENGNAGRPYYRCDQCGSFTCFADMRGVHPENPACDCDGNFSCRLQVAGRNDRSLRPGALFYTCAVGQCRFFQRVEDENG
ncbi:uncharacterized protein BO97DRAFT_309144, partial [Aspergillus homomorphus CBS 101889]